MIGLKNEPLDPKIGCDLEKGDRKKCAEILKSAPVVFKKAHLNLKKSLSEIKKLH